MSCLGFLMVAGNQGEVVEYTFKRASASFLVQRRWNTLEALFPGIQLVKDISKAPSTGVWVYVDVKRNRLVFGSRGDEAPYIAKMMSEFDVLPMRVVVTYKLTREEWKTQCSGSVDVGTGETTFIGSQTLGALIEVTPRINSDGSIGLKVLLETRPEKARAAAAAVVGSGKSTFQVQGGKAYIVAAANADPLAKVVTPPSGPTWNPYLIELSVRRID